MAPIQLVCFPFAGGSSWTFRQLASQLRGHIELMPVDLPGRGKRQGERCVDEWPELRKLLASELEPLLREPYGFLGYSLGALVALEVAHELASRCNSSIAMPAVLVACAACGPKAIRHPLIMHHLEDRAMFEALRNLGGIPDEFFTSSELIELSAPAMRADLRLSETYEPRGERLKGVRLHAYYGRNDNSVGEGFAAWVEETDAAFHSRPFDGGHMFLQENVSALANALVADLIIETSSQ